MNIYQKINEVRKKVEYIQKDAEVQNYRAVTHDAVTAMVRDHLIHYGIVIVPYQVGGTSKDAGTTKGGTPIIRFEASYEVWCINAEDPSDKFCVAMFAHANDSSDKAPGKACSYSVKYAMLKVFSIETGENEESRLEGERRASQLLEHIKSEVDNYIEQGDPLAIYLISKQVGPDAWTDIYNSAPSGRKQQFKKTLNEMETQGQEIFQNINQALLNQDALLASENLDGTTPRGKELLAKRLGRERSDSLGKLIAQLKQSENAA